MVQQPELLKLFLKYPPTPLFCDGGTPLLGRKGFCAKEIAGQYAREAIDRLSINHARSNQTCFRMYTSMFACVQVGLFAGGLCADCSACNPLWYLIDL